MGLGFGTTTLITPLITHFPGSFYTFFGVGASLCVIHARVTLLPRLPMDAAFSYFFIFLLLMLEAAVTMDIFFNRDWEEDFPEDSTGKLVDLKGFIKKNFEMCKWIGLSIVVIQING